VPFEAGCLFHVVAVLLDLDVAYASPSPVACEQLSAAHPAKQLNVVAVVELDEISVAVVAAEDGTHEVELLFDEGQVRTETERSAVLHVDQDVCLGMRFVVLKVEHFGGDSIVTDTNPLRACSLTLHPLVMVT
jgi:hypothetical protein